MHKTAAAMLSWGGAFGFALAVGTGIRCEGVVDESGMQHRRETAARIRGE